MTCLKCGGTGKVIDPVTGIEVACDCQINLKQEVKNKALEFLKKQQESKNDDGVEQGQFTQNLSNGEIKSVYCEGAVPEWRKDDNFSVEYLKEMIKARYKVDSKPINGMNSYIDTLSKIYLNIQEDKKVVNSYFISAHNGFGKTTFSNTCIKLLHSKGKSVVPYLPLVEIYNLINAENLLFRLAKAKLVPAEKQEVFSYSARNDKILSWDKTDIRDSQGNKTDEMVVGNYSIENFVKKYSSFGYSYHDFLECEVLFTCLSEPFLQGIEMPTLAYILKERSRHGKPTIVFGDRAMGTYIKEGDTKNYWDDLTVRTQYESRSLDRMVYVTCYRSK